MGAAYLTNPSTGPGTNSSIRTASADGLRLGVNPRGGIALDERFLVETNGLRPHQVRLEGGDASSDSYCYA